jgi:hypothetical protein
MCPLLLGGGGPRRCASTCTCRALLPRRYRHEAAPNLHTARPARPEGAGAGARARGHRPVDDAGPALARRVERPGGRGGVGRAASARRRWLCGRGCTWITWPAMGRPQVPAPALADASLASHDLVQTAEPSRFAGSSVADDRDFPNRSSPYRSRTCACGGLSRERWRAPLSHLRQPTQVAPTGLLGQVPSRTQPAPPGRGPSGP